MKESATPHDTISKHTSLVSVANDVMQKAQDNVPNNWLTAYKQAQIEGLNRASFPHQKQEYFKYNRLSVDTVAAFNTFAPANEAVLDIASRTIAGFDDDSQCERVVFVNGHLSLANSHITKHRITPFAQADEAQRQKILAQLATPEETVRNPFLQFNASVAGQGVLIEIDTHSEHSENAPIEILHIIDGEANASLMASQVVIDIADNSEATIMNRCLNWQSNTPHSNLSTQQVRVRLGENAQLYHYGLQLEGANHLVFADYTYDLLSNATLKAFHCATGSELKKIDVTIRHLGEYAHAFLNGLYVAADAQQVDYHTVIEHPLPNGQSDEVFRGIVNDNAEATFNGRIYIAEHAQKTRAELSNKNLMLSDNSQIHTKPELEIYADDVVCAHGATVSRLGDESLNYLRARAIPKAEAELMLSYGFFNEVLVDIAHEAVADYLRPILFKRFN